MAWSHLQHSSSASLIINCKERLPIPFSNNSICFIRTQLRFKGIPPMDDTILNTTVEELIQASNVEGKMSQPAGDTALQIAQLHSDRCGYSDLSDRTSQMRPSVISQDSELWTNSTPLPLDHQTEHPRSGLARFPRLPAELRIKIYQMTWEARRVPISRHRRAAYPSTRPDPDGDRYEGS